MAPRNCSCKRQVLTVQKSGKNFYLLTLRCPSSCSMSERNHNLSFVILHIFIQTGNTTKLNSLPVLSPQTEASLAHNSQYRLKLGSKQIMSLSLQYPLSYSALCRKVVNKSISHQTLCFSVI